MAGSVTVTRTRLAQNLEQITVAWTSDGSGDVSGNPFSIGAGTLQQVKFVPGSGTDQPDPAYDVVVNDADGCDVIVGKGANLSNTAASLGVQDAPLSWLTGGTLDLVVAGAGDTNTGTIELIVERS